MNSIFFEYFFINNSDLQISYGLSFKQKLKDYNTKNFAIFARKGCPNCGFFSFYNVHLGCLYKYLNEGYIPIIDMVSEKNRYNKGNKFILNPWEFFFYQIQNYSLKEVKKYAKNITYKSCNPNIYRPNEKLIYYHKYSINFWHKFSENYCPIKKELIFEAKIMMKKLFGSSKNILGVKIRGTDYLRRPIGHSIPAKVEQIIPDVKVLDRKNNYDFIYLATEDETIKNKFMLEFGAKVKFLELDKQKIFINEKIRHIVSVKNYILTIIILSKCLDFIACRCNGSAVAFILSKGFRFSKVYNLGEYKRE